MSGLLVTKTNECVMVDGLAASRAALDPEQARSIGRRMVRLANAIEREARARAIQRPPVDMLPWTTVRVARLRSLRAKGKSASEIAATLGGTTRSAVLGKAFRLGLEYDAPAS